MTRFVLDTSVMVKWFSALGEAETGSALWLRQEYLENNCQIIIPDLVLYELGNALRWNPHFTAVDVEAAIYSVVAMGLTIRPVEPEILAGAVRLAFQYAVTVYDAYFLALAANSEARLITADYKFHQKVGGDKTCVRLDTLLGA
jgi:predicted nucleic acid-binding protein